MVAGDRVLQLRTRGLCDTVKTLLVIAKDLIGRTHLPPIKTKVLDLVSGSLDNVQDGNFETPRPSMEDNYSTSF